ncbi:hypothetical protein PMZ80_000494 [Knufia obscura]|uniref:Pinin/SDK/MemA protein domain-containing protein n=2 Tax=Knufia TaxID=430999 RepID=A0AAN8FDX4_9EURO|nr:hypothetical protein PMZ80_000494 [Knufia obscura]KAK5956576.1 hypothetical protein OHC33_002062 [Knufia fluminis]
MIPSAVVVPNSEQPRPQNGSASPTLKRKLSHPTDHDRKRPRVDTNTDSLNYDDESKTSPPPQPAPSQPRSATTNGSATSPNHRRSSALGTATEEKKRNQRLFGGLLGVVSGSTPRSSPAHRKRDEIEARARERQKKENEEQEAERQRRREELVARRKKQQKVWDEESVRVRHRNMRDMAGFLRTRSQPVLYYRPWELRAEEEVIVERQKREVEEQIRRELGTDAPEEDLVKLDGDEAHRQNGDKQELLEEGMPEDEVGNHEPAHKEETGDSDGAGHQEEKQELPEHQEENEEKPKDDDTLGSPDSKVDANAGAPAFTNGVVDNTKEDDHHDGELVEGQEDDVIY